MRNIISAVFSVLMVCLFGQAGQAQSIDIHVVGKGSRPTIAVDNRSRVHVCLETLDSGKKTTDIFYSTSTDLGVTWSSPLNISNSTGDSVQADIAVEKSGAIDAVWSAVQENKIPGILFCRSTDGGISWAKPMDISNTPAAAVEPALAVGPDDTIHVVWNDSRRNDKVREIFYSNSKNGGKDWSTPINISNTAGDSFEPTIAVGHNGAIHIAWTDTTPGAEHPDIYCATFRNGVWNKPVDISYSLQTSAHPTLACGKGRTFLAWSDNSQKPNAADIWLAVSGHSGKFEKPLNVSTTPGVSSQAVAAANGGNLAVVWSDTTTGTQTPSIFLRVSLDGADDFSSVIRMKNDQRSQQHPDVAIGKDTMFAVWQDISGDENLVKIGSLQLRDIPTGPALEVYPTVHGVPGNQH